MKEKKKETPRTTPIHAQLKYHSSSSTKYYVCTLLFLARAILGLFPFISFFFSECELSYDKINNSLTFCALTASYSF